MTILYMSMIEYMYIHFKGYCKMIGHTVLFEHTLSLSRIPQVCLTPDEMPPFTSPLQILWKIIMGLWESSHYFGTILLYLYHSISY